MSRDPSLERGIRGVGAQSPLSGATTLASQAEWRGRLTACSAGGTAQAREAEPGSRPRCRQVLVRGPAHRCRGSRPRPDAPPTLCLAVQGAAGCAGPAGLGSAEMRWKTAALQFQLALGTWQVRMVFTEKESLANLRPRFPSASPRGRHVGPAESRQAAVLEAPPVRL